MAGSYHVVCHECAFEGLYEDASVAEGQRDAHTSDSGHQMSLRDISCQEAPGLSQ